MARWDESEHPRWPAGSPGDIDGQFRPKTGAKVRDLATLSRSTLLKYARERGLVLPRGVEEDAIRQAIRRFDSGGSEDWAGQIAKAIERKRPAKKATGGSAAPRTDLAPDEQARVRRLIRRDPQIFATTHDRFGRLSSSGNLSSEDAAWLDKMYKRDRAFVERAAQDATIERDIRRKAKDAGQTVAQYRAEVAAKLKQRLAGKAIAVRVRDEEALRDILAGGRFKTQHEGVKRAAGLYADVGHRRLGEQIHGVPKDTPAGRRPVYGYVAIGGVEPALAAGTKIEGIAQREDQEDVLSAYGMVQVVLKPEVRARTTITVGDSLDEIGFMRPTPIDDPGAESLGFRGLDTLERPGFTRVGYVEAQVGGGVRVEDIEQVVFPGTPARSTSDALDRRGIPWRVLRPGDAVVDSGGGDWAQQASKAIERKRGPEAKSQTDVPFNSRKHPPGTRVVWRASDGVDAFGTVGRAGRFTVIDWDSGKREKVRAGVNHDDIRVVTGAGPVREPRDMIDDATARTMLSRTGARDDVKITAGHYERSEYWVDADPVLEEIVYDQWGGAPAAAVGADEFDRLRASREVGLILYRGVEDGNAGVTAEQIHAQMSRQGKTRLGNGIFGNGWYMATTRRHAETYGLTARFGLRSDARTTTWEELVAEYDEWERDQKHRLGHSIEWDDRREAAYTSDKTGHSYPAGDPVVAAFGADLGRFAAARGYDAYRIKKGTSPGVGRPAGGNQWVVLNRGALVFDTETRTGKAK